MNLSPLPIQRFYDNNNVPLVGGLLFTYAAGTTTKLATYTDSTGGTPNPNPIPLNYRGEAKVWIDPLLTYKFVLAPSTDTDPPTNPFWSVDQIATGLTYANLIAILTQSFIGQIIYPRTAAEIAAGVTPINFIYPPGSFLRYGMDPTGVASSTSAFQNACACNDYVFDSFPGGGTYLFNTQAAISNYPLRIEGSVQGKLGPLNTPGTTFVLAAAAGAGAACLNFTSFSDLEVSRIKINLKASNGTLNQIGMRFAELRNSIIEKCSIYGPGTTSDDTTALQFDGTGTFTGGVTVRECYISNHLLGINLNGSITDWRAVCCTLYGTALHATSIGMNFGASTIDGPAVIGCSFNLWKRGIKSFCSGLKQIGNRFEDPNPQWEWVIGSAKNHQSMGDTFLGGGTPIWSRSDGDANQVFGAAGAFTGGGILQATRGFQEGAAGALRAYNAGYPQAVTFAAGNFTGNGAMTWTVILAGQASFWFSIIGKTLTVNFSISGNVGGAPNVALQIAIPGGFTAASFSLNSLSIFNGGAWAIGACQVAAAATVIQIFNTPAGATNWTAGAVQVVGQIAIQVN